MQKALVWLSVVLVVVFGGKALVDYMSASANENAASTRVSRFFEGVSAGGDFQDAFNMWHTGEAGAIQRMSQEEYNASVSQLNKWLAARQLARVESYELTGAKQVAPSEGLTEASVAVDCRVNGRPLTVLAIKNAPLAWLD